MWADGILAVLGTITRETMLLSAFGFALGGVDDLLVDAVFFLRLARRKLVGVRMPSHADVRARRPEMFAILIPAWDESTVIAQMLRSTLSRLDYPSYRILVGAYPNDPATIEVVRAVARDEPRVELVVGSKPGPTTKADCLNILWHKLLRDEAMGEAQVRAVVLHDAEDVVHPGELWQFNYWLREHAAVQLPVMPLPHPQSRWVSGHYLDEFALAHSRCLVVRKALEAGLPFAGTGCAIDRAMLGWIAETRGGDPFDASSLTEDYELGLTVNEMGGPSIFVRPYADGDPVVVRALFPARFQQAARQKARWMAGIALSGWDRTGWGQITDVFDHWMRLRDRRIIVAIPLLISAYLAMLTAALTWAGLMAVGRPHPGWDRELVILLQVNLVLLGWRLMMRAAFVGKAYGWREAMRSVPRLVVSDWISLWAAPQAMAMYWCSLNGRPPVWVKTQHEFPA